MTLSAPAAAMIARKKEASSVPVIEMATGDPNAQKLISAVGNALIVTVAVVVLLHPPALNAYVTT